MIYYEYPEACYARGVGFLDVEGCVNHVFRLKSAFETHGKSPCFSCCAFLSVVRQGEGAYVLGYVDGAECLD